jgi:RNA polymerase sigma-70 factor (ECF subfamily)
MPYQEALTLDQPLTSAPESDEMLMVRLMEGEEDAFDPLFARYGGRLRSFIFRFVGDREVAEDLTQEVFLKVYRNPRAFDPRGRFVTWIFAVARNACIDHLRLKKLPVVSISGADEDELRIDPASPATFAPEEAALHQELQGKVQEVLAQLSTKLREVFVLCAMQGMSYEDAASIIGCPVKTVSSRLSRARDQFFRAFSRYLEPGHGREGR